ncbi:hypothetical protein HanXRQr2_Chr10g0440481 [Helianthus annuus]|uniref:Transposase (Putative), gypsy type n=1 Tax=Helianthus annuus TaxID=4232 RepID=A0A9K3HXC4_HELAN|nr:hypothetical protein HanXRQr2_Chr10g0440481 [Helianthus annuus]KAJ0513817.1 hypothetical protein HanHA300_Chr10g0362221 [Helianthus annuus]KAJ0521751.1 hypothetical protein HanIR_Chr10g0474651 [Helianthus annuus]KAJ0529922.1 hypothetical protein HanHA89_Chr10g0383691 [Helianthus annuus]KAJ0696793.1 hypothetical protein HanLR1_Chr10g0361391 [Helianthus annuus]
MTWRLKRSRLPDPLPEDFEFNRDLYAALIKEAGHVQKFPEHILVMGKISMIWSEPEYYPTIKWNEEVSICFWFECNFFYTCLYFYFCVFFVQVYVYYVLPLSFFCAAMGLKEALRLKSFDSTELDVRATKTPKGDPPYLTMVKENLYPIREPVATTGQGGSSSAPSARAVNMVSVQAATVVGGDKGKKRGSSGAKGSGSKVILYGSEHLSMEDEGVNAEGDDDDGEVRPQVSFKRGRSTSSKPDPNPKKLKKTKLDLKTVVLEDEIDQVTGFSAAGGLLENLDAHLHGGSGDAVEVDSARALERYIPEWSLANKDRIVDALSAKMSLFHIGTPAEHAYYRKMSGPELGNALMLSQAQSNSLVVETYKRWIEAESNCRRFEREVAFLKNKENVRSKTKQELSSLRPQANQLKEQVSEVKEVSKASQASATAAYEASDKVVHDLESLKLKFEELEKKLSEVEERNKMEQKEMHSTYDQLLADQVRLIELERARDRAVESQQTMIADAKDMLSRYDGEMVELYSLVSELMLTKQWFLTDGVAWVVKLVHQSPELEKVVADLVNRVNTIGVNDGIKQGFQAAKSLTRSVEEVLGYDEGAKDTLDAAIKAFDNFHISVLDKVSELVNEPLSVIKKKSELPIIQEN